jgi:hypothetical protein
MMARLTIRTRLILLSSALLFVFVATNVYLTRKLADNSAAVAKVADLVDVIESANGARVAFGELRYWLTLSFASIADRHNPGTLGTSFYWRANRDIARHSNYWEISIARE